jgi:hypothetical protein
MYKLLVVLIISFQQLQSFYVSPHFVLNHIVVEEVLVKPKAPSGTQKTSRPTTYTVTIAAASLSPVHDIIVRCLPSLTLKTGF